MDKNKFATKIAKSIDEVSAEQWKRLFPPSLENYLFFKTIEESNLKDFSFYYILVYKNDSLVGIAPCFNMVYSLATTVQGYLKNIFLLLGRLCPGLFNLKTIICGSPATEGSIGIAEENKSEILEAILNKMKQIAKQEHAFAVAFKDFPEYYVPLLNPLVHKGFCKMRGYPAVKIDLHFNSFEEYLKTLSRSSRKSLRRKFRKVSALKKIECEVTNSIHHCLDEAYRLYQQVFNKSEVHFEEYTMEFLKKISDNMPQEVKYFLWRIEGKLVAFNLCLASEDTLIDEFLGLDYSVAYQYSLYFITFRDIITWCIENGIKKYESGALAYETKRRLGHIFIPLFIYASFTNKFLNRFIKLIAWSLRPENFDEGLKKSYKRITSEKQADA